jgi:N utilization substance protein B
VTAAATFEISTVREYFESIVRAVAVEREALDTQLAAWLDRKPAELDPVEHAVLLIGSWELRARPDVPWRVVINEAVELAKKYGDLESSKFVNGILDKIHKTEPLNKP